MNAMKIRTILISCCSALLFLGCGTSEPADINIGFIGPLTGHAVDLGVGPARALQLAVDQYNQKKTAEQPHVNLFCEDDHWEKENALPAYAKLRKEHAIEIVFVSNTDGTVALQQKVLEDHVILINAINNDALLSTMNKNTFKIAKKTEEAAAVVAGRILELNKKRLSIFYVTNDFMTRTAKAIEKIMLDRDIDCQMLPVDLHQSIFDREIEMCLKQNSDAIVFCGYQNLGFAMKKVRERGIDASYFGSTTLLGDNFFENAMGAMVGAEFSFFTPADGNYVLAEQFLQAYRKKYGANPFAIWPPMQAYDAMNLVLGYVGASAARSDDESLEDYLRKAMLSTTFYQGICGNVAILPDGSSRGIYFSLYSMTGKGMMEKVKR